MHKCQQTFSTMTDGDPEADLELSSDNTEITGQVRIHRDCEDCGTECKEYTFDVSQEVNPGGHLKHALTLNADDAQATDRMQNKDRRGKTITNYRYMKHLYGFEVSYTVTCDDCEGNPTVAEGSITDEIQASGMDELE